MCESIECKEEQEEQEVSACSEVLDIETQADVPLRAALLLWRLHRLQSNITASHQRREGERLPAAL